MGSAIPMPSAEKIVRFSLSNDRKCD